MTHAEDVAAAILDRSGRLDTIKLQKLVYYAQAWSATWRGGALFNDPVEAWDNGPVVRRLFNLHRGRFAVTSLSRGDASLVPDDARPVLDFVCGYYGPVPSADLVLHVHEEAPWVDAWEQGRNTTITVESMVEYYSELTELNDQRWYWSPGWYEGELAAAAEVEAGTVDLYPSAEDFLASLD